MRLRRATATRPAASRRENAGPFPRAAELTGDQREPDSVSVDITFLLFERLTLDLEPFFEPFPFAEPAHAVGDETSQPVAQGGHDEAGDRLSGRCQHRDIECIGAERHDGRGENISEKQAQQAEFFESEHIAVVIARQSYRIIYLEQNAAGLAICFPHVPPDLQADICFSMRRVGKRLTSGRRRAGKSLPDGNCLPLLSAVSRLS